MKSTRFFTRWSSSQMTSDETAIPTSLNNDDQYDKSYTESLLDETHDQNSKYKTRGKVVFSLLALLAIVSCVALIITSNGSSLKGGKSNGNVQIHGPDSLETTEGAVASGDRRCSEAGASILRDGGHAVDAAVATVVCAGVVNPTESSIGGGSFMIVREASTGEAIAYNMRETAPGAAHQDMYKDNPDTQFHGPLAMGVPGELKGLYEAHTKFGRLPWETLFQSAIHYARDGFEVFPYLAKYAAENCHRIMADPGLKSVLAPNGKVLEEGETCYNPMLANTLEQVARHGPKVFYNGVVGESFVTDVILKGGILTMDDLRNYKVNVTDVLEVDFLGYKLLGMHPPTSGTLGLAMISNIFRNYGSTEELKGALGVHRLTEALKHTLAIRMNLGDPAFVDISKVIAQMTSPLYGREIWKKIDDTTTFPPEYYESRWSQVEDHGTSHHSIVDKDRNAVAITSTITDFFGAKFLSPSTGIVANNVMMSFSIPTEVHPDHLPPASPNLIEPGKRPLSAMTPLIILQNNVLAGVMGATGGRNIPTAVIQTFLNHFIFEMDPVKAVRAPRVYPKLSMQDLDYENMTVFNGDRIELPTATRDFLATRHHNMTEVPYPAFCHIIVQNLGISLGLGRKLGDVKFGTITAVSDIRKGSEAAYE